MLSHQPTLNYRSFLQLVASLFIFGLATIFAPFAGAQTGHVMNGVGPTDQAMSGAGMAAPQDALTALHWNPASLFALPGKSLDFGFQLMMPTGNIESSVQAGAFGPAFGPPVTMS